MGGSWNKQSRPCVAVTLLHATVTLLCATLITACYMQLVATQHSRSPFPFPVHHSAAAFAVTAPGAPNPFILFNTLEYG